MDDMTALYARHKLDVDDVLRMAAAGIFQAEDRVELIEGDLIDMAPIGWDHVATVNGLTQAFFEAAAGRAIVSVQNPVMLGRYSLPEPDVALFRPRADRYRGGEPPGPADVLLLVEVSDSSLRYDTQLKLPLYARAGIGEYWIVDLTRRVLLAHTDPADGAYATVRTFGPADAVKLQLAPEITVALDAVFG